VAAGAPFAEFASLCPGRRVGAGRRVEALAFVVVGVPGDEPGVVSCLTRPCRQIAGRMQSRVRQVRARFSNQIAGDLDLSQ
jgi:hypothetical protein